MADHTDKDFEDVIVFPLSKPGAMEPNDIGFFKNSASKYTVVID